MADIQVCVAPSSRTNSVLKIVSFVFSRSFSAVSTAVFEFLQCIPAGSTKVVLVQPAIDCESSEYQDRRIVVYGLLLLWIGAVPVAMYLFVRSLRKRHVLADKGVLQRYGFLYATYRSSFYWFETAILLRRVAVSALAVLLAQYPADRTAALTIFFLLCLLLQCLWLPFFHRVSNICEVVSLSGLLILSALTSGHSLLHDDQYPLLVQLSAAVIVSTIGLGLFVRVLLRRFKGQPLASSLSMWFGSIWHRISATLDRGTADEAFYPSLTNLDRDGDLAGSDVYMDDASFTELSSVTAGDHSVHHSSLRAPLLNNP